MPQGHLDCTFSLSSGNRNNCYNHPQSLFLMSSWRTKCRNVYNKNKPPPHPPKKPPTSPQKIPRKFIMKIVFDLGQVQAPFLKTKSYSFVIHSHNCFGRKLSEEKQRICSIQKAYPRLTELWTYWAILKHTVL